MFSTFIAIELGKVSELTVKEEEDLEYVTTISLKEDKQEIQLEIRSISTEAG